MMDEGKARGSYIIFQEAPAQQSTEFSYFLILGKSSTLQEGQSRQILSCFPLTHSAKEKRHGWPTMEVIRADRWEMQIYNAGCRALPGSLWPAKKPKETLSPYPLKSIRRGWSDSPLSILRISKAESKDADTVIHRVSPGTENGAPMHLGSVSLWNSVVIPINLLNCTGYGSLCFDRFN